MLPEQRLQLIADNLQKVNQKIEVAAELSGRTREDIDLITVTKTWPPEIIEMVIKCGIKHLGENRIQEAVPKINILNEKYDNLVWHMIGHLQSNKAKLSAEKFDIIQSVDSFKIAKRISDFATKMNKKVPVLIEVNISGEASKFGVEPLDILNLAEKIKTLSGIDLRGLMTIGPLTSDELTIRKAFQKMKKHFDEMVKNISDNIDILSMGMSDDFGVAIEEGSTMVRIGRAIFGARN